MSQDEKTDITRIDQLSSYDHSQDDLDLNLDLGTDIVNRKESKKKSKEARKEEEEKIENTTSATVTIAMEESEKNVHDEEVAVTDHQEAFHDHDASSFDVSPSESQDFITSSNDFESSPSFNEDDNASQIASNLTFIESEHSDSISLSSNDFASSEEKSEDKRENAQNFQTDPFTAAREDEEEANEKRKNQGLINEQISKGHSLEEAKERVKKGQNTLEEIHSFGQNMRYGKVTLGANPPYSLLLQNVKSEEDAQSIFLILKEHGLADDEALILQGLKSARSLLISQINEYSAIFLAHKLKGFGLDIQVGPSQKIHPSQSYDNDEDAQGFILADKGSYEQNKEEEG